MDNSEGINEISEIQFKQTLENYYLILKNVNKNRVSTINFLLTNNQNEKLMNVELSETNFERFVNSLKKFAAILKETDPKVPSTTAPRPREDRATPAGGFSEFF